MDAFGAAASAMTSATIPSMRPVARFLSSLWFPAGSDETTAFAAHMADAVL
jgi:hypothetical protein